MATPLKLWAKNTLIKEGELSHSMYWVQSGTLIVTKKQGNEEIVLEQINAGELVGEISFLDQQPRSATVRAISDCELIQIPFESMETIFKSQPKWLEILVKTLAERLRQANNRIKV